MLQFSEISQCGIGGSSDFASVFVLPQLPLTEAFGPYDPLFHACDQELLVSTSTGHVQLRYQILPSQLYSVDNYAFRSGSSNKSEREFLLLQRFIQASLKGRPSRNVLEIGGNDLALANLMRPFAETYTACDPLLIADDGGEIEGVSIIGTSIEEAIDAQRFSRPDLLIARHTLEHIANPRLTLRLLLEAGSDDCLYVFEVPSLEHLTEAQRFDAVFHQHYHYFDLDSVHRLIWEIGGEYVSHEYNYQGSNGGSLLFSFRRGNERSGPPQIDVTAKIARLRDRISLFTRQMKIAGSLFDELPGPIYGFGAGHMLATLDYHLEQRLNRVTCVLDDDPDKEGFQYRNVDVKVRATQTFQVPDQASYVITSMENVRSIYQRIQSMNPRRILVPQIA